MTLYHHISVLSALHWENSIYILVIISHTGDIRMFVLFLTSEIFQIQTINVQ